MHSDNMILVLAELLAILYIGVLGVTVYTGSLVLFVTISLSGGR